MAKEEKKAKTEFVPSPRKVKAITKHLRIAPRKMRIVIDTIRRQMALEAVGILMLMKKKEKLITTLTGIRKLNRLPAVMFVVDTIKEQIAIAEARRLKIPIGAIVDTNCNPDEIDYPIPGNDDALKSVQLITKTVADTVLASGAPFIAEEIEKAKKLKTTRAEAVSDDLTELIEDEEAPVLPPVAGIVPEDSAVKKHRVVRKRIVKFTEEE